MSQPMSPKRSLQVSTYLLLQMQGSVMSTMMKAGSTKNLVLGVEVGVGAGVGLGFGLGLGLGLG